eukprot:11549241-Heterocapsa_arctica.AAC.1
MRAERGSSHRPRSIVNDNDPKHRRCEVAPPRRMLYGLKPHSSRPKLSVKALKSRRNRVGDDWRSGSLSGRPCISLNASLQMHSSSSVTLSAAPFLLPVFVRPKLITPRH